MKILRPVATRSSLRQVLVAALPPWRAALAGSLLAAAIMALSAITGLTLEGWNSAAAIGDVAAIFGIGGLLGFPSGLYTARVLGPRGRGARFAAAFLGFTICTVAATSLLYAVQYRLYYAQWHDPAFTRIWALQLVFTIASAIYQFLVLGLRLYFPVGFVAVIAAAWWHALAASPR